MSNKLTKIYNELKNDRSFKEVKLYGTPPNPPEGLKEEEFLDMVAQAVQETPLYQKFAGGSQIAGDVENGAILFFANEEVGVRIQYKRDSVTIECVVDYRRGRPDIRVKDSITINDVEQAHTMKSKVENMLRNTDMYRDRESLNRDKPSSERLTAMQEHLKEDFKRGSTDYIDDRGDTLILGKATFKRANDDRGYFDLSQDKFHPFTWVEFRFFVNDRIDVDFVNPAHRTCQMNGWREGQSEDDWTTLKDTLKDYRDDAEVRDQNER